jgi:hypothetical protein
VTLVPLPACLGALITLPRPQRRLGGVVAMGPSGVRKQIDRFTVERQQRDQWCWAALTHGVLGAYRKAPPAQCDVATRFFQRDCCHDGGAENTPQILTEVLDRFKLRHGDVLGGSLAPAAVRSEIAAGRPICIQIEWTDGRAHVVGIGGYVDGGDGRFYVLVSDPGTGGNPIEVPADSFVYLGGGWAWTFRTRPPGI